MSTVCMIFLVRGGYVNSLAVDHQERMFPIIPLPVASGKDKLLLRGHYGGSYLLFGTKGVGGLGNKSFIAEDCLAISVRR